MSYPTISVSPPSTTLPFAYSHLIEYFDKGIDAQGPFYKVQYYISDWADADAMANAMMGISTFSGTITSGSGNKVPPHSHPLSPNLYCQAANVRGCGKPVLNAMGRPNYLGGAIIEAEYRPQTPYAFSSTPEEIRQQVDPGTPLLFCSQEVELTTETYLVPNTQMTFTATGAKVNQPFRMYVSIANLALTFHKLPYIPMVAARALRVKVNNAAFMGAAAGCVLFKGARFTRDWDVSGNVTQKVLLNFSERDPTQKWNWLPDPTDLVWKEVQGPGAVLPYGAADLSPLVQL